MSLRDELDAPKANGGRCSVKAFVTDQANPEEWIELLDDKSLQHSQLYRLMRKHGFILTSNPITRHRNGQCSCGRATG
jgi:hypothetical protein